ncbi:site-specific recombinase XerC [Streptosporangium album]|uniref:Site-specific recombinase XerC n=1 Tax=Streptosporangium album TaxID=47479 RepID=A0A7W7RQX7_9ACTN|nr:site-specific integrase [Streptosporangium album]MBB4936513.1 site-specific recombinase XerC [Streptosporangium album]
MFSGCCCPTAGVSRGQCSIERSPNTVKAYARDLKDWFVFLHRQGLDWRDVRLEDVAEFIASLCRAPVARDGSVSLLPSVEHHCGEAPASGKLSARAE